MAKDPLASPVVPMEVCHARIAVPKRRALVVVVVESG